MLVPQSANASLSKPLWIVNNSSFNGRPTVVNLRNSRSELYANRTGTSFAAQSVSFGSFWPPPLRTPAQSSLNSRMEYMTQEKLVALQVDEFVLGKVPGVSPPREQINYELNKAWISSLSVFYYKSKVGFLSINFVWVQSLVLVLWMKSDINDTTIVSELFLKNFASHNAKNIDKAATRRTIYIRWPSATQQTFSKLRWCPVKSLMQRSWGAYRLTFQMHSMLSI